MNDDMEYTNNIETQKEPVFNAYGSEEKPKKKRGGAGLVAVALCCSLLGSALGAGGVIAWNAMQEEEENVTVIMKGDREPSVIQIAQIDTSKVMTHD